MSESANVSEAVTAECPMAVYERLERSNELVWDSRLSLWVAVGAERVRAVLEHPDLAVRPPGEPIPKAFVGTEAGEIFSTFARMSEGADHRRRKDVVSDVLDKITADHAARATCTVLSAFQRPPTLDELQFHVPVMALGEMLGVPPAKWGNLVAWTAALVRAAAPGASVADVDAGKDAASRLVESLEADALFAPLEGDLLTPAERVANAIGLLFQTHDATAGLIGNMVVALARDPDIDIGHALHDVIRQDMPVHNTRRYATKDLTVHGTEIRQGDTVLVVLASTDTDEFADSIAFGHGRHRCPGEHIALAIAKEIVDDIRRTGAIPAGHGDAITMHRSGNVRIPDFRLVTESGEAT